jgi:hypothetical protein
MRTIEQRGHAWAALLKQAEKSPVHIYYRGVNDKEQALWEITTKGVPICTTGTERQIMQGLEPKETN